MPKILNNHTVADDEWDEISSLFPPEQYQAGQRGRPRLTNRQVFQAMLYWLADGLAKRRVKQYTGIGYDTLAARLDEWNEQGVFRKLWRAALANHDQLCGLRTSLLLIDGAIKIALNGGDHTGPNPTDRGRSGAKAHPLTDAARHANRLGH
jgi:transposase